MATGMLQEGALFAQLDYIQRNRWTITVPGMTFGSGSAAKVKNGNTINYILNGVVQTTLAASEFTPALPTNYGRGNASDTGAAAALPGVRFDLALAASNPQAFPKVLATIPVSSAQRYLLVIDGAQAIWTLPSYIAAGATAPDAPPMPKGYGCLGDVTIATDASHTFVPGTTAFNGTGITSTFRDLLWPDTGLSAIAESRTGFLV